MLSFQVSKSVVVASLMRQIYYYRLGSIAARLGCYAVRAGLKLRAAVALPPIFTAICPDHHAEVSGLAVGIGEDQVAVGVDFR